MATDLSVPQRATLLRLMVAGREVANAELSGTHGVYLNRAQRDVLVNLGYISVRKGPRNALFLELTEPGWRACHDQLTASPPPRGGGSLGKTLYGVLAGLAGFLDRSGLRLADVFGDGPVTVAPSEVDVDVEGRIRQAYRKLVSRPRGWVGLADLRRHLDGIPEREVDEALRALFRSPHANLVPESNQKALTDEDRRAAVRIGGEDKHLLSIEDA